jgi:hypothetical protein
MLIGYRSSIQFSKIPIAPTTDSYNCIRMQYFVAGEMAFQSETKLLKLRL